MRGLISFHRIKSYTKTFCKLTQNQRYCSYVPVKFASEVIIPKGGEDRSLNPIVYHHGLTGSKELWHEVPQIIADATKRLGYIYDGRNHGDSEWTDEFSYELIIEDLRYFMESQNLKKAIVVGHSSGGWIISMFALKYPHMVEMLINEDASLIIEVMRATSEHVLHYISLWEEGVKSAPKELNEAEAIIHAFNYLYDRIPSTKALEEKEYLYRYRYPIKRTPEGYDVKHNMKVIRKYLTEGAEESLKHEIDGYYGGPGLFMMASLSPFHMGMDGEDIKKKFPNVEMEIIDGVSHNIHLRFPDIFIEHFLSFYRKHYPTS